MITPDQIGATIGSAAATVIMVVAGQMHFNKQQLDRLSGIEQAMKRFAEDVMSIKTALGQESSRIDFLFLAVSGAVPDRRRKKAKNQSSERRRSVDTENQT